MNKSEVAYSATRCRTIKSDGTRCQRMALVGATVCYHHGGYNPAVRAKAIIRKHLREWVIDPEDIPDPGEVMLKHVAIANARAGMYSDLLKHAVEVCEEIGEDQKFEVPKVMLAMTGLKPDQYDGGLTAIQAVNLFLPIEAAERERAFNFAQKAALAGLAERQVRLAEQQGALILTALFVGLDAAGITGELRVVAQNAIAEFLLTQAGEVARNPDPVTLAITS